LVIIWRQFFEGFPVASFLVVLNSPPSPPLGDHSGFNNEEKGNNPQKSVNTDNTDDNT
jgi:hypothetical protein